MSLETIRTAILTKLQGALPGAKLYGHERFSAMEKTFRPLYVVNDDPKEPAIFGGYIRRLSTRELINTTEYNLEIHKWAIRIYRSFIDNDDPALASETLFDADIEAVRQAFRLDETLNDLIETSYIDGMAGIQLDDSGPVEFAGVLCHGARFTLQTQKSASSAIDPDGEATGFNVTIDPSQPEGDAKIEAKETF